MEKIKNSSAHLVGALNTPNVGTLPSQIALSAVIISVLLFQKLMDKRQIRESVHSPHNPSSPLIKTLI